MGNGHSFGSRCRAPGDRTRGSCQGPGAATDPDGRSSGGTAGGSAGAAGGAETRIGVASQAGSSDRWRKTPDCHQEKKTARCVRSGLGLSSLPPNEKACAMFTLTPQASTAETTQRGSLRIAPRDLVERFGPPLPASGDRKVSGSYTFTDTQGNVATVYDWKATALYDGRPETNLPTVTTFWASTASTEFCVAARGLVDFRAFARWLEARITPL